MKNRILCIIVLSTFLLLLPTTVLAPQSSPLPSANTPIGSPQILGGWGGIRLIDTQPNLTAPVSLVFPNEQQSNFEQVALREYYLGYNALRASFAPYCAVQYGLNTQATPQDFMGNYSSAQLGRAIQIAQRLNMWLIVDYHGRADLTNSTLVDCWLKFWFGPNTVSGPTGVVGAFRNTYDEIVWEPLNEPDGSTFPVIHAFCSQNAAQCDDNSTAYMSSQYQTWLDLDRRLGDTHWVVLQNLCSYSCYRSRDQYYLDYPIVNDTMSHVFESFHTYLNYGLATTSQDGVTKDSSLWNNTTADIFARRDYLTMLNETNNPRLRWPILNTEGGTSCGTVNGTSCLRSTLAVIPGAAGYTSVSLRYIQDIVNYEDSNNLRFGRLLWPAGPWTTTTPDSAVYGAIHTDQWGTMITSAVFEAPPLVIITGVSPNPASTKQTVTIGFNVTEPSGSISSVSVNWGDQTPTSIFSGGSNSATHTYTRAGSSTSQAYTVNVTATDNAGSTGYSTRDITVIDQSAGTTRTSPSLFPTAYFVGAIGAAIGILATIGALRMRRRIQKPGSF